MTDITFITSNTTKLAHARHLCNGYDVNILHYKKLFYGKGYEEPRILDREKLLAESINDAMRRWKKNGKNFDNRLFFIEDTSVKIEALSDENTEVPGVDIKYWMQDYSFKKLDAELKEKENNRKVSVSSHVILFLTKDIKEKIHSNNDYMIFSSHSNGTIVNEELFFDTQILYPWLDNKSFNKWFVPDNYKVPISMLSISDADKADFRKGAFEQMLNFLKEYTVIKYIQKETFVPRLLFNPLYIVCGSTCAGKSTIGKLLLEEYDYYHIEASDFMSLKYFETHGTKFTIDKNVYAAELLKVNPLVVVENTKNYLLSKKIYDNFIITGFRTEDEVSSFLKIFPSNQNIKLIFIIANPLIRFNRWKNRQRDTTEYTEERFAQINKLQEDMGLPKIQEMKETILYENNGNILSELYADFQKKMINIEPISKKINIDFIAAKEKISLEKVILIVLALKYKKNESLYYTTTEISHLINNMFNEFTKNKNNVSRYFNQSYYPYYEIKREANKNKYKLSPTGYSEAMFIIKGL